MKTSVGRIQMAFLDRLAERIWEEYEKEQYIDSDRKREFAEDRARELADAVYDSLLDAEGTGS